jgi:hypothetical protein
MANSLQTVNFTTTDGLNISVDEYPKHMIYRITDQAGMLYKVTIREIGKQFVVQPHFYYGKAVEHGYSIYSEAERKKRHLGTIKMSKDFPNSNDAEVAAVEAVRNSGKVIPPNLIFLNEIENAILQIKSNPESDQIPTLLDIMQTQLDYLKLRNK